MIIVLTFILVVFYISLAFEVERRKKRFIIKFSQRKSIKLKRKFYHFIKVMVFFT